MKKNLSQLNYTHINKMTMAQARNLPQNGPFENENPLSP